MLGKVWGEYKKLSNLSGRSYAVRLGDPLILKCKRLLGERRMEMFQKKRVSKICFLELKWPPWVRSVTCASSTGDPWPLASERRGQRHRQCGAAGTSKFGRRKHDANAYTPKAPPPTRSKMHICPLIWKRVLPRNFLESSLSLKSRNILGKSIF